MQYTGKTVEEVKALALSELGITEEKAIITVIEEPTKGLFGRLKGKAVIEVEVKEEKKAKADSTENTLKFVQGVLDIMDELVSQRNASITSFDDLKDVLFKRFE